MEISTVYPFEKDIPDMRDLGSTRPFSTYNSRDSRLRPVNAIVAMGRDRSIGINGDMPWHIREDLRHFKALTSGHPVIMGRATWESLPKRPLPGRLNIVVTRNPDYVAEGAQTAPSIEAALDLCPVGDVPFIIGGGSIYAQAMPIVSRMFITRVDADFPDADTFFPDLDPQQWTMVSEDGPHRTDSGLTYSFLELRRI